MSRSILLTVFAATALISGAAHAQDPITTQKRERVWTHERERKGTALSVYSAGLIQGGLAAVFIDAFRWNFVGSTMVSVLVQRSVGNWDMRIGRVRLNGWSLEAEGQLIKHFGVEDHFEATGSVLFRTGEIKLGQHASFNIGIANGLSWAFSKPKWEWGPTKERGVDAPQLLWHIGVEAEISSPHLQGLSGFARIHHRSENYGALGAPWYHSNRIGLGIRYRFQ